MNDILLNDDFDLRFENGDLVIGESTKQHQQLLVLTKKGDWKENPTVGVGVAAYLKDDADTDLLGAIRTEFEKDGMIVNSIEKNNEDFIIDAHY